jgi:pyridoxal phosphate enzyme (YggS family)
VSRDEIAARLEALRGRIAAAAKRAGRRPEDVTLVGVSKRKPASDIAAAVAAGLCHVGENYLQEALVKLPLVESALAAEGLPRPRWHFVGRLQRNKARHVAAHFDLLETLDRPALGDELDRRAAAAGRRLETLLQVDVSGEPQKGGVAPEELPALLETSTRWHALRVVGLMAIPPTVSDPEQSRGAFARLRELRDAVRGAPGAEALRELSMGMTCDFEVAIEEGATIIRVGTALFGAREAPARGEP